MHLPRPGHADLAGVQKYGFSDVRNVLERRQRARDRRAGGGRRAGQGLPARARRRVVRSHVTRIGAVAAPGARRPRPEDFEGVDESPVRCLDADASEAMVAEIDARAQGQRVARRGVRGARVRPRAGDRLARLLGGAPRRPPGPGGHVDPGDEGRGDRRRLRARRARRARRPTTRSSGPRSAASSARPTARAASRAA